MMTSGDAGLSYRQVLKKAEHVFIRVIL